MTDEPYYQRAKREAGENLAKLISIPDPETGDDIMDSSMFDPWKHFGFYGTYDGEFDACALDVLEELVVHQAKRDDLGAQMFRERLCIMNLCEYGSSPRVCFPSSQFEAFLPELIRKWKNFSLLLWGLDVRA